MDPVSPIDKVGAANEAADTARRMGLRHVEARVLHVAHNLIVAIDPAIVARVGWITSLLRDPEQARQSLLLSAFLSDAGMPVTRPSSLIDPGPHISPSGCVVTFWERLQLRGGRPSPGAVGNSLRRIHVAAAHYPGPMQRLDPLGEARRVAELSGRWFPREARRVTTLTEALAMPAIAGQPIHGDAGFHNAFVTAQGLVWGDWEESAVGPVEWDLAALTLRSRIFGEQAPEIDAATRAYGEHDRSLLATMHVIFATWASAWGLLAHARDGEPIGRRTLLRLEWAERASARLPTSG